MNHMKRIAAALLTTAALVAAGGAMAQDGAKVFVVGGKADDPFWAIVKKGFDDASLVVEAHGGSTTYRQPQTYDNLGLDAANLVRTAMSQGATAIAVPDWVTEAQDEAIKAAVDAGIPVIVFNAGGAEKAAALGALNYIGSDEYIAGKAGGEYIAKNDGTKVVCVNTVPGAANLEARCKGVIDGVTARWRDRGAAAAAADRLRQPDRGRRGDQGAAAEEPGRQRDHHDQRRRRRQRCQRHHAGRCPGPGQARHLRHEPDQPRPHQGRAQLFSIDQQPYLQGFLAVSLLDAHVNFGTALPTKPGADRAGHRRRLERRSDAEPAGQRVDVVSAPLRALQERLVGHEARPGDIGVQGRGGLRAGLVGGERRVFCDDRRDRVAGDLARPDLEPIGTAASRGARWPRRAQRRPSSGEPSSAASASSSGKWLSVWKKKASTSSVEVAERTRMLALSKKAASERAVSASTTLFAPMIARKRARSAGSSASPA